MCVLAPALERLDGRVLRGVQHLMVVALPARTFSDMWHLPLVSIVGGIRQARTVVEPWCLLVPAHARLELRRVWRLECFCRRLCDVKFRRYVRKRLSVDRDGVVLCSRSPNRYLTEIDVGVILVLLLVHDGMGVLAHALIAFGVLRSEFWQLLGIDAAVHCLNFALRVALEARSSCN